jgi:hypothetical protein
MTSQKSSSLIANTLPRPRTAAFPPVVRTLDHAAPDPRAARQQDGPRDPYRVTDRALDHVVERLLKELTW